MWMPAATLLVPQLSPLCLPCVSKRKLIPTPCRRVFVTHASACSQIIVTTSVRRRLLKQEDCSEEVSMLTLLFFSNSSLSGKELAEHTNVDEWLTKGFSLASASQKQKCLLGQRQNRAEIFLSSYWACFSGN